jgi:hypothetical protein
MMPGKVLRFLEMAKAVRREVYRAWGALSIHSFLSSREVWVVGQFEKSFPQGLKPTSFCWIYVRAEARTLQNDPSPKFAMN